MTDVDPGMDFRLWVDECVRASNLPWTIADYVLMCVHARGQDRNDDADLEILRKERDLMVRELARVCRQWGACERDRDSLRKAVQGLTHKEGPYR